MRCAMLGLAIAAVLIIGCDEGKGRWIGGVAGNGDIIHDVRSLEDFSAIEIGGALPLVFEVGPVSEVTVVADENITPFIHTEVDNGKLEIGVQNGVNLRPTRSIKILVTGPDLEKLDISGASRATLKGLDEVRLTVDGSGAAKIEAEGRATHLDVDLTGACTLDASGLASDAVTIDLSGASSANVEARRSIEGEVTGASRITYSGSAEKIAIDTSGASTVKRVKSTKRHGGEL